MTLSFVSRDDFGVEEETLQQGLDTHNAQCGLPSDHDLGEFCYDENRLIGGATGQVVGDRLLVKLVWVDGGYRGRGVAAQLMHGLETRALRDKCQVAFVNTYGYQAPGFYRKCGYTEVARIADYVAGHDRIFYRKELA